MLIALTALPRSGKDTAADHLVKEFGFYKDSFGGDIYKEVSAAFGISIEDLQSDFWKKNDVPELALANCTDEEFVNEVWKHLDDSFGPSNAAHEKYEMELPRSSRFILQRWATEYRRAQDPLYWVKKTEERVYNALAATCYNGDVVISDLREMHEYTQLQLIAENLSIPFRVVEIVREGTIKSAHSSDAGIPEKFIHTRIQNEEGRPELSLSAMSRMVKNIKRIV